jgi:hypothetical protein
VARSGKPARAFLFCAEHVRHWRCKSSSQPDGGEVIAKRKGVAARRGLKEPRSKSASRWTRTGLEADSAGRAGNESRSPYPSRALDVNPAVVRGGGGTYLGRSLAGHEIVTEDGAIHPDRAGEVSKGRSTHASEEVRTVLRKEGEREGSTVARLMPNSDPAFRTGKPEELAFPKPLAAALLGFLSLERHLLGSF